LRTLIAFINRMNILVWVLGIFVGHALLYLLLGTDTWLATSLFAAAFYAIVLLIAKLAVRRYDVDKEKFR
jgi:membrane protein implicated in regulation of membrane protease activity